MQKINKRKEFFSPVRNNPWGFALMAVFSLFEAVYVTYSVVILEKITAMIEAKNIAWLKHWIIIFVCIVIWRFIYRMLFKVRNFKMIRDTGIFVDTRCLKKYIEADNNKTEKIGTGRMIAIYKRWVYIRLDLIADLFWWPLTSVLIIIMSTIMIARKWATFLLLLLVLYAVVIIRIKLFAHKANYWRRQAKEVETEIDRMFVRRLMTKFEMMQQNKYQTEARNSQTLNHQRYWFKVREKLRQGFCYDGANFLAYLTMIAIVWFVWRWAIQGHYSYAQFVLLSGMSTIFVGQVSRWAEIGKRLSDNIVHLQKMRDTFDTIKAEKKFDQWEKFTFKKGNINIKNLTYGYNKNMIFKNFNLNITGWQKTAFVWPSGWGKSTLIKLIAWYLTADSWEIIIDNQTLPNQKMTHHDSFINVQTFYHHIGYLTQEPSLFDGTIRENLGYALSDEEALLASKDKSWWNHNHLQQRIDEAIIASKCEFVYDLPQGIDTEIGERGIRLSWGQRQRLAIAKIFLKNPEIVLLDEPTSSLDSFAEEAVTEAMNNLFKNRTVIIIAHRLQTVKHADEIIVLSSDQHNHTQVVEKWSHQELITLWWHYAKMLELQSWF